MNQATSVLFHWGADQGKSTVAYPEEKNISLLDQAHDQPQFEGRNLKKLLFKNMKKKI